MGTLLRLLYTTNLYIPPRPSIHFLLFQDFNFLITHFNASENLVELTICFCILFALFTFSLFASHLARMVVSMRFLSGLGCCAGWCREGRNTMSIYVSVNWELMHIILISNSMKTATSKELRWELQIFSVALCLLYCVLYSTCNTPL